MGQINVGSSSSPLSRSPLTNGHDHLNVRNGVAKERAQLVGTPVLWSVECYGGHVEGWGVVFPWVGHLPNATPGFRAAGLPNIRSSWPLPWGRGARYCCVCCRHAWTWIKKKNVQQTWARRYTSENIGKWNQYTPKFFGRGYNKYDFVRTEPGNLWQSCAFGKTHSVLLPSNP